MRSPRPLGLAGLVIGLSVSLVPAAVAQEGATITVAQDGSGDHDTISGAIEAAVDGDTVLIAPGAYAESFLVDKDITLSGDGDRSDVIVSPGVDGLLPFDSPNGPVELVVLFQESEADVEHLAFEAPASSHVAWVSGGAVDFLDVSFVGSEVSLVGGRPTLSDTSIDAYIAVREGASPTIEDSEILGHVSVDGPGRTIIRRSTLHDGTSASWDATGAYEGNHFIGVPLMVDTGSDMLVKGNLIEGVQSGAGIMVIDAGSTAEIVDNTVRDSTIGIVVDSDEPGSSIVGNTISDIRIGIHVDSDSPVEIVENTIDAARNAGIVLQGDGASVLDNSICGLGVAFDIRSGSPNILSNDVCAELEP